MLINTAAHLKLLEKKKEKEKKKERKCKGSHGEKIEQVLSTIHFLSRTILAQAIAHKKK